nr:LysR family transcriptional regulator [uncultured Roseovarius sp.]
MRLEWIEDILAVIDYGSFASAAKVRLLTPSAFTRRIRTIEEALGAPLFDRDRKPVVLLPHAARLEAELRETAVQLRGLKLALSDPRAQQVARVTLMCQHALAAAVAPSLVHFLSGTSEIQISVESGSRAECKFNLLQREIDFALVYQNPEEDLATEIGYLSSLTLGSEIFAPVANFDRNPLLRQKIAENRIPTIIYPEGIFLGSILRRKIFPRLAPEIEIQSVAESSLTLAIVEFVRRGLGVAWLPLTVVSREIAIGEMQLIDSLPSCNLKVDLLRLSGNAPQRNDDYWAAITAQVDPEIASSRPILDFVSSQKAPYRKVN